MTTVTSNVIDSPGTTLVDDGVRVTVTAWDVPGTTKINISMIAAVRRVLTAVVTRFALDLDIILAYTLNAKGQKVIL